MNAGDLRHVIQIEKRVTAQDSFGEPIVTWTSFAKVRAAVEPLNGREYFAARAVQEDYTVRFRIRYMSGLDTDMRIVHDSIDYDIQAIINIDERNRDITIMARLRQE